MVREDSWAARSLKIAIVTERFPPQLGGCEIRYFEIARRLAKKGHEIHVFTTRYPGLSSETIMDGVHVHRFCSVKNYTTETGLRSLSGVLRFSFFAPRALDRWGDFDVYEFNQWPLLPAIADRWHHPRVVTWSEVWDREYMKYGGKTMGLGGRVLERLLSKSQVQRHVTVASLTLRRLREIYGLSRGVVEVPTGVDNKFFNEIGVPKVFGRLCYVGRIVPHKHVHDWLIEAYEIVRTKVPCVELHIVGDGPLATLVQKRCIHDSGIHIHGKLPLRQMAELLCSSWVFVLASEREGLPNIVMESMASGTPVVAVKTPMSGVDEVVFDNTTGKLAEPNPHSIAAGILQLLEDQQLWKLVQHNGSQLVKDYDWEAVSNRMEEVYRAVAL